MVSFEKEVGGPQWFVISKNGFTNGHHKEGLSIFKDRHLKNTRNTFEISLKRRKRGETKIRKRTQTRKETQTLVSDMFAYLRFWCYKGSIGLRI